MQSQPTHPLVRPTLLPALLLLALFGLAAFPAAAQQSSPGTLVIVFRDGHRQTFNLADIAHLEFPSSDAAASTVNPLPSRAHYLGRWQVGDGNGSNFIITLREDGTATRSLGGVRGHWHYIDGEARIRWDDGNQDVVRKIGSSYRKCWYRAGRSFTGDPDNITDARNLTDNPAGID